MGAFRVGGGLAQTSVVVDTTATLVAVGRTLRKSVLVKNNTSTTLYLGGEDVTIADGMPLAPNEALGFDDYNGPVYAVAAVVASVRVLEVA